METIFISCNIIQCARNKLISYDKSISFSFERATGWVAIKDTSKLKVGNMLNYFEDLLITHKLRVARILPKANSIIEVI